MSKAEIVKQQFEAYIIGLAEYFKAEPAARHVIHLRWGLIERETAIRIADLVQASHSEVAR